MLDALGKPSTLPRPPESDLNTLDEDQSSGASAGHNPATVCDSCGWHRVHNVPRCNICQCRVCPWCRVNHGCGDTSTQTGAISSVLGLDATVNAQPSREHRNALCAACGLFCWVTGCSTCVLQLCQACLWTHSCSVPISGTLRQCYRCQTMQLHIHLLQCRRCSHSLCNDCVPEHAARCRPCLSQVRCRGCRESVAINALLQCQACRQVMCRACLHIHQPCLQPWHTGPIAALAHPPALLQDDESSDGTPEDRRVRAQVHAVVLPEHPLRRVREVCTGGQLQGVLTVGRTPDRGERYYQGINVRFEPERVVLKAEDVIRMFGMMRCGIGIANIKPALQTAQLK